MDDLDLSPRPSPGELAILQVLWKLKSATVREVHDALAKQREIGYTTVLKTMQIMFDKGLLRRDERERAHVYRPAVRPDDAKNDLVGDLMDRAFGGSARDLVMHALTAKRASAEDLAAIRKLLEELEAKND